MAQRNPISENPIGLAELIEKVKEELLSTDPRSGEVPFLSVDEVTLELQVTVEKKGNAGITIHVIQIGGSLSRDDVQTISVTLTPLLSKEARLQYYEQNYPGGVAAAVEELAKVGTRGTLKGSAKESQKQTFRDRGVKK